MNIDKRSIVGGVVIVGVLWYAGTHSEGLDPTSATVPALGATSQDTSALDCFRVLADGQSHPCDIPDPPVMMWTVTDHGAYHPDGDCWSLGMTLLPAPGMDGGAFMRTCVPKPDYDAHPVGSKYSTNEPRTGLSGGSATRITDGN
jgi:hypothetical protein